MGQLRVGSGHLKFRFSTGTRAFAAIQVALETAIGTVFLATPVTAICFDTKVGLVMILQRNHVSLNFPIDERLTL